MNTKSIKTIPLSMTTLTRRHLNSPPSKVLPVAQEWASQDRWLTEHCTGLPKLLLYTKNFKPAKSSKGSINILSRVHYLHSINRKVTENTILKCLRITSQYYPFLLSNLQTFTSCCSHNVYTWMLYSHAKLNTLKTSSLTFLLESAGPICSLVSKLLNSP